MKSFKFPSRNRVVVDDNPLETICPLCKHRQAVSEDNSEMVYNTITYWCESCGEQYVQGMKCYDYKYS